MEDQHQTHYETAEVSTQPPHEYEMTHNILLNNNNSLHDLHQSSSSQPHFQSLGSRNVRIPIDQSSSPSMENQQHPQPPTSRVSTQPCPAESEMTLIPNNNNKCLHDVHQSSSPHQSQFQSEGSRNVKLPFDQVYQYLPSQNDQHQPHHEPTTSEVSSQPFSAESEITQIPHSNDQPQLLQSQGSRNVQTPINQVHQSLPSQNAQFISHNLSMEDQHQPHHESPTSEVSTQPFPADSEITQIPHSNDQPQLLQSQGSRNVQIPIDQLHQSLPSQNDQCISLLSMEDQLQKTHDEPVISVSTQPPPLESEIIQIPYSHNNSLHQSSFSQPQLLQSQGSRVVQLPIDQVYRFLPSQNEHRSSSYSETSEDNSLYYDTACCSVFLLILFISIVLVAIIACIFYLALNPKTPRFFIDSFRFKTPQNYNGSDHRLIRYNLSMETENPNSHISLYYLKGGSASLSYKEQEIASGEPPAFYHGKKDTRIFFLLLSSSKVLPREIAAIIMKGSKSKVKIPLTVLIRLPVKLKLWSLKIWKMNMKVTCDVSIVVLSKNVNLGSEQCKNSIG